MRTAPRPRRPSRSPTRATRWRSSSSWRRRTTWLRKRSARSSSTSPIMRSLGDVRVIGPADPRPLEGMRRSADLLHEARERERAGCMPEAIQGYESAITAAERSGRSEEHTSELQSHSDLVCRLLLEKKKKNMITIAKEHVDNRIQ